MKIFFSKSKKENITNLKNRISFGLECLVLVLIMCMFGVFLTVQNMHKETPKKNFVEVGNNIVFDIIELEIKDTENEMVDNKSEQTNMNFWQIFEEKQKINHGQNN